LDSWNWDSRLFLSHWHNTNQNLQMVWISRLWLGQQSPMMCFLIPLLSQQRLASLNGNRYVHFITVYTELILVLCASNIFIIFLINFQPSNLYLIFHYPINHVHITGHHVSHDKPPATQHHFLSIPWYPCTISIYALLVLNNPDPPRHPSTPEGYANDIINDFNIASFLTHPIVLPLVLMTKYHMNASHISYHHTVTSHTHPSLIITGWYTYFLFYMNPIPITYKRHSTCTVALALYSCTVNAILEALLYSKLWVSTKCLCSWMNCYTPVTFITTSSNPSNVTRLDHCPVQAITLGHIILAQKIACYHHSSYKCIRLCMGSCPRGWHQLKEWAGVEWLCIGKCTI
jgi:hypothetical protein